MRSTWDCYLTDIFEPQSRMVLEGIREDYGSEQKYCETPWGSSIDNATVDSQHVQDILGEQRI